jgi:hypothetical protein
MENKKFEQLIELIINENEEQAKELFHDIVVEKSREIYENIMAEEAMEESMHDGMGEAHPAGQVMDMLDEISAEEEDSMSEDEDDEDIKFDDEAEEAGDELTHDMEAGHDDEGEDAEELEDRVVDIEDKLDMLMAKFEKEIMGNDGEEVEVDVDDGEEVMEAVQLQKVSVTHGDDGANKKSVVAANSGAKGMDSKPVKFSGDHEAVPTSPKGPSNEYSKKEGELPGAGSFKNVPGGKAKVDLSAAPKPVTKDGSANSKSPVAKG